MRLTFCFLFISQAAGFLHTTINKPGWSSASASAATSNRGKTNQQKLQVSVSVPIADYNIVDDADGTAKEATAASAEQPRVGVLMLNLGGPETGDDVEGFLYNLFADPDIIQLPGPLSPLQPFIAWFISSRRAPKSREAYASIGGGSPILKYSNEQARLIAESIQERYGVAVKTYIGMRYWYPFTEEALDEIQKDKIEALVILPLYPQFSISTSGSSLRVLQEEFIKHPTKYNNMVHTVVPSWYDRPGYVQAMLDLMMEQLDSFSEEELQEQREAGNGQLKPRHVLFSAHGVPQKYIEAGDPYQSQMLECVDIISAKLPDDVEVHLSYQSRVGPIEWLRPYTDDVLPSLGESGVKNLVVVPISFVSEHIETLEEIDIEYRELAEESGISNWRRCPALNTNKGFVDDMGDLVMEALAEPAQTVTEVCVANRVRDVELQPLDERLGINTVGIQGVGGESDKLLGDRERVIARIATASVFFAILTEFINGKSIAQVFGL
mmetsp:Transcript_21857/g.28275  ORF Transcript_21857/g.28275 Transcript_21857/m.28275 type:complete len:496 (+) Transcript_21857:119-1606(+)|eukprot:CAMPEP_0198151328 /NCGR_PEP_ID=MMETSP1443-20131203/55230_1 /TAXON_ID=186043 /ORGANISM="Entomoneis sp., Strain CCMP2396" /LENGTH=495 /DNA_ID=CAMNT_0043816959 /DNA_START=44 /DNA_END=1531 /DNA_ORIENTATION=-